MGMLPTSQCRGLPTLSRAISSTLTILTPRARSCSSTQHSRFKLASSRTCSWCLGCRHSRLSYIIPLLWVAPWQAVQLVTWNTTRNHTTSVPDTFCVRMTKIASFRHRTNVAIQHATCMRPRFWWCGRYLHGWQSKLTVTLSRDFEWAVLAIRCQISTFTEIFLH